MRATPVAAVPALLLVVAGQSGASLHVPWLGQHAVLGLDAVGRIFLGFTSVLWLTSGWYARAYLAHDPNPVRFHLFFLLAMAGNFGLILASDVPTFYACFTLMGLASAGLVLHRGDAEAVRAGRVYLALAMLGEVLIFTGFVFLTVSGGTTQIAELHRGVFSQPALLLLLAGFGIKAGALSLHFWLPLAHPAAPVPASAVLSGAMLKAGLLGWIRFLPLGEAAMPLSGFTLISAGLGAAVLGTFVGVVQKNPKTVLAYSSISQMGIITTGIGIGALRPESWLDIQWAVLIYATHHALAKGALFLGIGPAHAAQTRLQVITARVGLLLPALALAGAPFTSGGLAKVAIKSNIAFLPGGWADLSGHSAAARRRRHRAQDGTVPLADMAETSASGRGTRERPVATLALSGWGRAGRCVAAAGRARFAARQAHPGEALAGDLAAAGRRWIGDAGRMAAAMVLR